MAGVDRRVQAALAVLIAVGALGGLVYFTGSGRSAADASATAAQDTTSGPRSQQLPSKRARREAAQEASANDAPPPAPGEPARSLRGTEIDGALRVGPDGKLILGPEVIALFDYFLAATGEESESAIRARIEAAIRARLTGPAADEALTLLDTYLAYRNASKRMRMPAGAESDPAARLEAIRDLRRTHFGEEAASLLFGNEEREGLVAVEQSRILKDSSLSPEEREAKLAELEAKLPDPAQRARAEAVRPLLEQREEEAMRAAGATEAEIHEHRVKTLGKEGAERLADLDRRRAEWKQRVEAFRTARDKLTAGIASESARQAAEQRLLEDSFTPEEQLRVKAILGMSAK